jgi:hypothetical protein
VAVEVAVAVAVEEDSKYPPVKPGVQPLTFQRCIFAAVSGRLSIDCQQDEVAIEQLLVNRLKSSQIE